MKRIQKEKKKNFLSEKERIYLLSFFLNEYLPYMSSFVYSMFLNNSKEKKKSNCGDGHEASNDFKILVFRSLHCWWQEFRGVPIFLRPSYSDSSELG